MSWIGWAVGGVVLAAGGYIVWRKLDGQNRLAAERYNGSFAAHGGTEIHKQNLADVQKRAEAGLAPAIAAPGGFSVGTARIA